MDTTINKYDVKVIRKKIKNTYIRVKNGEIVVTTNYFTTKMYINKLIRDNFKDIERMLEKEKLKNIWNDNFYLLGKYYDILYDDSVSGVIVGDSYIRVRNNGLLDEYISNLVKNLFSKRLSFWYNKFEESIPFPNLKIRKMKSRWGVCNAKNNNVTLNYYLYRYDLDCLDYVIVHELSHFLEPNHSKSFWKVVEKYYPNYKEVRKKLRS